MAPTEILARQHFDSIVKIVAGKTQVALLTRSQFLVWGEDKKMKKNEVVDLIGRGEIKIVIGTHALISEKVKFDKLGLVVVDEQHRFGVEQRKQIKEKSPLELTPHFLSMTATPIPRSLALTIYGDLDLSVISELPVGRKPILTRLVEPFNRARAYDFVREQIKKGRQAFVICPLIEGGTEKKSVAVEYEKLSRQVFPDLKAGFLHGRLSADEKEKTMARFRAGETDILVSTSVVEVGVDIPNASVMIVEDAERFGLAQLHQFRGRVGRASHQSYCLLFTESVSKETIARLKFFETTRDGFKLAEKDLETRGPGEVYGTTQSGFDSLRLARLSDREIIKKAREAARILTLDWDKTKHLYPLFFSRFNSSFKDVHFE
jgi:ATP-dependent DNA helicase RecG